MESSEILLVEYELNTISEPKEIFFPLTSPTIAVP